MQRINTKMALLATVVYRLHIYPLVIEYVYRNCIRMLCVWLAPKSLLDCILGNWQETRPMFNLRPKVEKLFSLEEMICI